MPSLRYSPLVADRRRVTRSGVVESRDTAALPQPPVRGHCLACGCPLTMLGGDPPRRWCVTCVERGRAEVLPTIEVVAMRGESQIGEASDVKRGTPPRGTSRVRR